MSGAARASYVLPSADDTRALGEALAARLRPGDLVILTGDVGAGKTTFTQGIGAGLGVGGAVVSPTFIIARTHAPGAAGVGLVHVDAYRLTSLAELDHLDLDTALDDGVTVVEWGGDLAEALSPEWLHIAFERPRGGDLSEDPEAGQRSVVVTAAGARWDNADLDALA